MGQKSNLITVRKIESVLTIIEENSKSFINVFEFFRTFNLFLQHRKIWVFKTCLNSITNACNISFDLFYLTIKCLKYKRKMKSRRNILKKASNKNKKFLNKFFSLFFRNYKKNFYNFSFIVLNTKVNIDTLSEVYFKTRAFIKTLFQRRYHLYLDFVKVFVLVCHGLVHVSALLFVLSNILRFLTKHSHGKFIELLKAIFIDIDSIAETTIKGLKFTINGKLKGQTRASSYSILTGPVVRQSLGKKVEFGIIHTSTRIGVFGMRLWLNRK